MRSITAVAILLAAYFIAGCKAAKTINKVIAPKDSVAVALPGANIEDSLNLVKDANEKLARNYIDFKTFSARIKVDIEDANGKQPDIVATLRMVKDSAIWLSLNATFLNIEVYRALITPDSVILMNKQEKEVQYRTLDYLQEVIAIPFDFTSIQNMLLGNPFFFDTLNANYRQGANEILISSVGDIFKNLLTLSSGNGLALQSKLDDVDLNRNRTASVSYDDYVPFQDKMFSTRRQIIITEKNRIDIRLNFKQFEFNKELSVGFSVPKNYKQK